MLKDINIVIDGPVASGKTSIANILSKKINFKFFDTGLMYRAFTYLCINQNINFDDLEAIKSILNNFDYKINDHNNIFINNKQIIKTHLISKQIIENINKISKLDFVRNKMVIMQRNILKDKKYVVVGRDIGTVVLPNAEIKIFLTAKIEIRAKRRYKEEVKNNLITSYDKVLNELIKRDNNDINRKISPLKQANDAILIDNSYLNLEESVLKIIKILDKKGYKYE